MIAEYYRQYRANPKNKQRLRDIRRKYDSKPEVKQKKALRRVTAESRAYHREYHRTRYASDLNFRLANCLRARLRKALKRNWKSGSAVRDLGCSIESLKSWLMYQFQPGMTWENYGEWEIDHVKPLASFDLTDRTQLLEACNWFNLQPMWANDNLQKRDK